MFKWAQAVGFARLWAGPCTHHVTASRKIICTSFRHTFVTHEPRNSAQTVRLRGVIGLEGSTRMNKNGHLSIQGEALGDVGYKSKSYVTHQPCSHTSWTWKGHVGSKKMKISEQAEKTNIPTSFGTICVLNAKTKMTALARSID